VTGPDDVDQLPSCDGRRRVRGRHTDQVRSARPR
jgi:hypothetical protein